MADLDEAEIDISRRCVLPSPHVAKPLLRAGCSVDNQCSVHPTDEVRRPPETVDPGLPVRPLTHVVKQNQGRAALAQGRPEQFLELLYGAGVVLVQRRCARQGVHDDEVWLEGIHLFHQGVQHGVLGTLSCMEITWSGERLRWPVPSLRDVQDFARHADPSTTRRYDRGRDNLDRNAAHILATYFAEP